MAAITSSADQLGYGPKGDATALRTGNPPLSTSTRLHMRLWVGERGSLPAGGLARELLHWPPGSGRFPSGSAPPRAYCRGQGVTIALGGTVGDGRQVCQRVWGRVYAPMCDARKAGMLSEWLTVKRPPSAGEVSLMLGSSERADRPPDRSLITFAHERPAIKRWPRLTRVPQPT